LVVIDGRLGAQRYITDSNGVFRVRFPSFDLEADRLDLAQDRRVSGKAGKGASGSEL
jgi:hypothetical protein